MTNGSPLSFYTQRIAALTAERSKLRNKHAWLGWARLAAAVTEIICVYYFWRTNGLLLAGISIVCISVFLWLVSKALAVDASVQHASRLIAINQQELQVLSGKYYHLNDGIAFMEALHVVDNDLDLFGRASLFQYTNRSNGYFAQLLLAKSFIESTDRDEILLKQEAVKELKNKIEWCQQLQSYSNTAPITIETYEALTSWLQEEKDEFSGAGWQVLRFLVPVISFSVLIAYLLGYAGDGFFNTCMLLMLGFVFSFYKKISIAYQALSKRVPELNALLPALQWIESASFDASFLKENQLALTQPQIASKEIGELKSILKRLDYRLNPVVYIPLSIFLFWDLQQVLALRKWKKKQTGEMGNWFNAAGRFEMLSSMAVLAFNNPAWTFPEISNNWFEFECTGAGHPLLPPQKAVLNDYATKGTPAITLITGSNMAGKSTFLRTIGANMVLALSGAPVNAGSMTLPVLRILTSMRITDNLEDGTSTFYAELKKMKRIVDAVNAGEKVFILLDEMLRGTNTLDRHTGSMALVRQLIRHNAVAMIASHDIALAELETEYPGIITNYHFDSAIISNEIVFDYRLKDGICQSTNASLLMQKIGIEIP